SEWSSHHPQSEPATLNKDVTVDSRHWPAYCPNAIQSDPIATFQHARHRNFIRSRHLDSSCIGDVVCGLCNSDIPFEDRSNPTIGWMTQTSCQGTTIG